MANRYVITYLKNKKRICHFMNNRDDASTIHMWLATKKEVKKLELVQITEIDDVELLRCMAMGRMPPLSRFR